MNAGVGCQGTVLSDPQVTGEGKNSQNPGASAEPRARPAGTGQHQALKRGGLVLCTHESGGGVPLRKGPEDGSMVRHATGD